MFQPHQTASTPKRQKGRGVFSISNSNAAPNLGNLVNVGGLVTATAVDKMIRVMAINSFILGDWRSWKGRNEGNWFARRARLGVMDVMIATNRKRKLRYANSAVRDRIRN